MATTPINSSAASTPLTAPITLTSVSPFSSDFQSVLNRAVSIANLPVQQLQNQDTNVQSQQAELATLGTVVSNFQTSLTALGTLGSSQALSAASSDSSVVSVEATGATNPATYTISKITSVAAAAAETSLTGYASGSTAPVSSTGTLTLVVGSHSYQVLSPASGTNTLAGVAQGINAAGAGVTATVLTTGTGATPNYLSITANNTGASTLQLFDGTPASGTNLLTNLNQGADAIFNLNNLPVDNPNNTINDVVPGLTFTIANTTSTGQTVNLSLASDPTQLQSALQDFVTQYNALSSAATSQVGQGAGLLAGNPIVQQLQAGLRQVTAFEGAPGAAIHSLSDLGIEVDQTGKMSLNTTTLNALSSSQAASAFAFLGSATTGLGGLSQQFVSITDPYSGMIFEQQSAFTTTDQNLQSQISSLNARISLMQSNLSTQLEAADALEAQLTSQQNELSSTIQSLNYSAFGANAATSNTVG
jgi:flagellar hook-associated protein 2